MQYISQVAKPKRRYAQLALKAFQAFKEAVPFEKSSKYTAKLSQADQQICLLQEKLSQTKISNIKRANAQERKRKNF